MAGQAASPGPLTRKPHDILRWWDVSAERATLEPNTPLQAVGNPGCEDLEFLYPSLNWASSIPQRKLPQASISQEMHTPSVFPIPSEPQSRSGEPFPQSPLTMVWVWPRGDQTLDLSQGLEPTGPSCHGICSNHSIARAVLLATWKVESSGTQCSPLGFRVSSG